MRRQLFGCGQTRPAWIFVRSAAQGPAGRITHEDLEAFFARGAQKPGITALAPDNSVKEIKVVGLRRKIAEKMAIAKSHIPHITYVEEIDVTSLEELRATLNYQQARRSAET